MAGPIFINYRRGENLRDAQHLATLLAQRFGDKRIFLDVRGIDGGEQWLHALEKQVAGSDAMVALIGKTWIDLKDNEGNRRLDSANDFVRFEIAQALQRNIPVLPVLLDGTQMPKINQLPHDLMALTLFQGMPLRVESVVQDAEAIARRLKIMLDQRKRGGVSAWMAAAGAAVILAAGVAAGAYGTGALAPAPGELQARLSVAKDEAATAREEMERLRTALQERDQARSMLNQRIVDLRKAIETADAEIAAARADAERLRPAVQERDQARSALANANQKVLDLQKINEAANADTAVARSALANANQKIVNLQAAIYVVNDQIAKADTELLRALTAQWDSTTTRTLIADFRQRLEAMSRQLREGDSRPYMIPPTVRRGSEQATLRQPAKGTESMIRSVWGMTLSVLTEELRRSYKIDGKIDGAVVTALEPSLAAEKQLRVGDVILKINDEKVADPEDVQKRVIQFKANGRTSVVLLVASLDGRFRYADFSLR